MVIFLFSISAASAHDNTTNDIGICDDQTNQVTLEIDEIGNFTDLNNEISKITAGGNYTLKKDYTYSPNDSDYVNGINITNDNIVIDGNGHTINGAGKARIFNILSNNVILKNINFINGHSSENGGAIYVENAISNCKINSTFINNSAYNGGAIYFNGAITNATINGHFEGNTAERAGGAIYVKGTSRNNTFACEFYNNTANKASGGAIFFYNLAENNQFESVLRYNHGIYGAGIFFYNKANNNRFKCDFRFNVAESCGGAIFFHNTTNNNSFSGYFINNTALGNVDDVNGNGGAITFKDTSSNCIFTCDFINNTAAKNGGGVNYRQTPYNITFNSDFINNKARTGGGVNFFESLENVVFNGQFIGNSAVYGGAIAAKNGVIKNTNFLKNCAERGGAIHFDSNGTIINCEFEKNNAEDGGAILSYGNLVIINSVFKDNVATLGTNHISLKENASVTLDNTTPKDLEPFRVGYLTILNCTNITYGESVNITAKITDENNAPLANGTISVMINGKAYTGNVNNGTATIEIPNINAGIYNVNVTYIADGYLASSPVKFKVLKQKATIAASNKAYVITYGGKYSISLKDAKGNAIANKKLTFKLNGKNIGSAVTNTKGVATIALTAKILKAAKAGKKNLVIQFADSNYNTASKTVKITINKEKTKIIAKNAKFKKSKKIKKYSITLKNSKGKAVKNANVVLKVKGKIYKAKTNSKGKATFKISKLNKKGKFNAVIQFKTTSYYKAITKKVKISVK